ncbi:hypothetical protein KY290_010439 [Solanum tuberosum]|uniref:Uncharacterized protein n=1 Tax=Solanum tuberosum TaxID=4113 RepID=A0ABQ7VXT5_SOLTU|nr:hypothetical protein KY290_010439 [Solanum tuberosum]
MHRRSFSVRVSNELGLGRPMATKYSVAIGGGWQGLVAYINLRSYYVFGIPLGYTIGYVSNLNLGVVMKQY